jgi:hypothetical protein
MNRKSGGSGGGNGGGDSGGGNGGGFQFNMNVEGLEDMMKEALKKFTKVDAELAKKASRIYQDVTADNGAKLKRGLAREANKLKKEDGSWDLMGMVRCLYSCCSTCFS